MLGKSNSARRDHFFFALLCGKWGKNQCLGIIKINLILFLFFSKDVRLPVQLQRAMAAEAEAAREARAKVIAAEGEQKASR